MSENPRARVPGERAGTGRLCSQTGLRSQLEQAACRRAGLFPRLLGSLQQKAVPPRDWFSGVPRLGAEEQGLLAL